MTQRKPLVLIDGIQAQLPPGDTLDAMTVQASIELINTGDRPYPVGAPVIFATLNEFDGAIATSRPQAEVVGLLSQPGPIGLSTLIQDAGRLSTTAANWQLVTEDEAKLIPGAIYYLSPTIAGKITNVPPTTPGTYIVRLGKALSENDFQIDIEPPIGL